jgi:hypothetical protein
MIYGCVPYQSKTIDDLLYDICNIGPSFNHINPLNNQKIEVPEKLKDLIKSLLNPVSDDRVNHQNLFNLVLDDPHFEKNFSGQTESQINQSSLTQKSSTIEPVIDQFISTVKYERSKYTFLTDLAKTTLGYNS